MREAGQIDGLTEFGCFLRIDLPLSMPGIATATILAVIFSWNNFLFSLILAGSDTLTLPVVIFQFMSYAGINWGGLMAGASVMTMPIIVFALFAQKYVVGGLTAGATKG
jgi:multiple sugar transport system permease protein